MGRGHLSRLLPLVLVLAVAASASAASTIPFRVVAHGVSTVRTTGRPFALVATSRVGAQRIVRDGPAGKQLVLRVNYRTSIVVGVFGPFGCKDGRVRIARVTEAGKTLTVHLVLSPLPPGTAECLAIYETARVLVVPRAALAGTPTKALVAVA